MDGESAAVEQPTSETAVETIESTPEARESTLEQADAQPDKNDARRNPDPIRKHLKSLRNNPETAKIADEYARWGNEVKGYKTFFPKVGDARAASELIKSAGGSQAITEALASAASMRDIDEALASGDASIVPQLLEAGPEGIVKILPALMQELQKTHGRELQGMIQPLALDFMDQAGLPSTIDQMVGIFNDQQMKPEEKLSSVRRLLAEMVRWYKGLGSKTDKPPEQQRWEQERTQWAQERYETSIGDVFNRQGGVIDYAQRKIMEKLTPDAKKIGISGDADYVDLLLKDIWKVIENKRNNDPDFKALRESKFNERSKKVSPDATQWMNGFTDKHFSAAYQQVMGHRLKHVQNGQPPKKDNPTEAPAGVTVTFDQNMTIKKLGSTDAMRDALLSGRGYDKEGKEIFKSGKVWKRK